MRRHKKHFQFYEVSNLLGTGVPRNEDGRQ